MKKKVFFIMNTDNYSGAEKVNFSIINELKDKFDFYWVSIKGKINEFLEEEDINWIEIEKLSASEIKRIVKEYNPDILHATDYKATVICSLSNVNVPIISHLHNNAPWIKKFHPYSFLYLFSCRKVDKILTVSDSIEKEYIFSKFLKNKITNVSNPVSVSSILEKVTENCEKKYDICCVGRITEAKNPKLFIKVIAELVKKFPNLKVVWVGDGECQDITIEEATKLNVLKNIDFVGFKENPFIYMAMSKLFLLTSKWEGYGLVAFEALALGLPCVVSNVGGLPDIVNEKCGYICNQLEEYIYFIEKILLDNTLYNSLSKNAILRAGDLDNLKKYSSTIDDIYREVLENDN